MWICACARGCEDTNSCAKNINSRIFFQTLDSVFVSGYTVEVHDENGVLITETHVVSCWFVLALSLK